MSGSSFAVVGSGLDISPFLKRFTTDPNFNLHECGIQEYPYLENKKQALLHLVSDEDACYLYFPAKYSVVEGNKPIETISPEEAQHILAHELMNIVHHFMNNGYVSKMEALVYVYSQFEIELNEVISVD